MTPPERTDRRQPVRVGLVGLGKMARAHSLAFHAIQTTSRTRIAQTAVCGRDRTLASAFAAAYGWERAAAGWTDLVADESIDVIDIATPPDAHYEIAIAASKAGKTVICEKPLATSLHDALAMEQATECAGIASMVIFNYRFTPGIRLASRLIARGAIGAPVHFSVSFQQDWLLDPNRRQSWRSNASVAGGGAAADLAVHLIDLVHYLVGPVRRVSADYRIQADADIRSPVELVDEAAVALLVTDHTVGTLLVSRVAPGHRSSATIEIAGTKGSLRWSLQRLNDLDVFLPDSDPAIDGWRRISATRPNVHLPPELSWGAGHVLGWADSLVYQMSAFFGDDPEDSKGLPTFADGVRAQRVLEALTLSAGSHTWQET